MAKTTVNFGGKDIVLDMGRPGVADAVANLIKLAAERQFPIGMVFDHVEDDGTEQEYLLTRILQTDGSYRAYLINVATGRARNSRKVVKVQGCSKGNYGYVTTLPAEKDRFIDPDTGEYIQD